MLDVVLDTNVLFAALRSSLGASYRLLQTLEQGTWKPNVSPALALEYESVLKRDPEQFGLISGDIDDFLAYLFSRSTLVQIYFNWRPTLIDPDDDRILEVAVRTRSHLVTFNLNDFKGAERLGVAVVTPRDFLHLLSAKK